MPSVSQYGNKAEYLRQWRKENPGAFKYWKYGVTEDQYQDMILKQNSSCAICKTDEPKGRHNKWQIDHCHKTGAVRGLLCWKCNTALGAFQDSIETLESAIVYLKERNKHE